MKQVITTLILVLSIGLLHTCNHPDDLEAVSGLQGRVEFIGEMPDSIKAVAVVVLETEASNDPDNIVKYLVNYSDPLNQSGDYYIQLKPDHYMGVLVGLLIDPGVFVVNIDSYLDSTDLPLVQITEDPIGIFIQEGKTSDYNWDAAF